MQAQTGRNERIRPTEPSAVRAVTQASDHAAPFLSVVIPAYNEERRLGPTLAGVVAYLEARSQPSELVVVSDGSTDGTVEIANLARERLDAESPVRLKVIAYSPNRGKGCAVRTGVMATSGRYTAFLDADLSTPVHELDRALQFLGADGSDASQFDVIVGSRVATGAEIRQSQPLYRRLAAKLFNVFRDQLVGIRGVRDTQCGLKAFRGDIARRIFALQRIDGFMFDVETVYIAQRLRLRILEMGVQWTDAPESKVKLSSGLRMVPDLIRIRRLHGRLRP